MSSDKSSDSLREAELMAAVAPYYFEIEEESRRLEPMPAAKRQKSVLLIEDSEDAMLLVKFALEEYGNGLYGLRWAPSLSDGIDYLSSDGPDVILLDLGLPESSGPASYAWVREVAPKTPVIVLTGDSRLETEFAVTASGADGYLVKNHVSGAQLLQAIQFALATSRRRRKVYDIGRNQGEC
jgi:DNA-binding response OmpR family regulator